MENADEGANKLMNPIIRIIIHSEFIPLLTVIPTIGSKKELKLPIGEEGERSWGKKTMGLVPAASRGIFVWLIHSPLPSPLSSPSFLMLPLLHPSPPFPPLILNPLFFPPIFCTIPFYSLYFLSLIFFWYGFEYYCVFSIFIRSFFFWLFYIFFCILFAFIYCVFPLHFPSSDHSTMPTKKPINGTKNGLGYIPSSSILTHQREVHPLRHSGSLRVQKKQPFFGPVVNDWLAPLPHPPVIFVHLILPSHFLHISPFPPFIWVEGRPRLRLAHFFVHFALLFI
jgi:hypothetical protein